MAEVEAQEAAFAHERRISSRKGLALRRLARQPHLERPAMPSTPPQPEPVDGRAAPQSAPSLTHAPSRYDTFRHITPALVTKYTERMRTAAKVLEDWRNAYRQARAEVQRGLKALRPMGTWWLKDQRLAPCEPVPADPVALCLAQRFSLPESTWRSGD